MAIDPRTPVLVGVGQALQREDDPLAAKDPVGLMVDAVRAAEVDAGLAAGALAPALESIRVVALLSWRYRDPARFLAEDLGAEPRETVLTTHGGNTPQSLVNLTALEIQRGELDCVLLAGAETWRTRMRAQRREVRLPWRKLPEGEGPTRTLGKEMTPGHEAEVAHGVQQPVTTYPMFENALRAAAGESIEEHQVRVSQLWARFSEVAADNPYAWLRDARSPEDIRTVSPTNRMIGFPYPKSMNSMNDVDQAAALVLCSAEKARSLGVPEDRWVFPWAGTDAHDTLQLSNRQDFRSSPAIRHAGRRCLELAGVGVDDLALVDLYSCFPSAVQIGAAELGLGLDRDLTVTGGLCFAGGPWNDYVSHSIATMAGRLREQPGSVGLITANGGNVTKHAIGVWSATPPPQPFRSEDVQALVDAEPQRELAEGHAGPVTIETYTVMHDRDGEPEVLMAACLLADGRRTWASSRDRDLATHGTQHELCGAAAAVDAQGTLTLDGR